MTVFLQVCIFGGNADVFRTLARIDDRRQLIRGKLGQHIPGFKPKEPLTIGRKKTKPMRMPD
jgi:hypothetical protein